MCTLRRLGADGQAAHPLAAHGFALQTTCNVIADNTHIGLPTAAVAVLPTVTSDDARCRDTRPSGTSVWAHGAQSACGQIEYRMGTLTVLRARTLYPNYICVGRCTPQRVRVRRYCCGKGRGSPPPLMHPEGHAMTCRAGQSRYSAAWHGVSHVCMLQPDLYRMLYAATGQDTTGQDGNGNETKRNGNERAGHRKATNAVSVG